MSTRFLNARLALILVVGFALAARVEAQPCSTYFPFTKGAELEMQTFDAKDKLTGRILYRITDVTESAGERTAQVEMTVFDKKDKPSDPMAYSVQCKGGSMLIEMKRFLNQDQMEAYKDMEINAESSYLEVPGQLSPGATLQDASMTAQVMNGGKKMAEMSVAVTNRKVVGQESITTPAGTFEAYKITSDMEMGTRAMGIKLPGFGASSVEWYVKDVGVVRSESYRKGKLIGYSVLTRKN